MEHRPTNPLVRALLTDCYQLTMAYAQWRHGRHEEPAVFELFFRKPPFGGEYALMGGVYEALGLLNTFRFTPEDIEYIRREIVVDAPEAFYEWLANVDASSMKIWAIPEGTPVFPRVPLMIVSGPIAIGHLLETALLNLVNFSSLVMTNARRMVEEAGPDKQLLEFGLRRAQGPDGALTASRCAYIAGFASVSTVLAGALYGIPVKGTHAHAFVTSFSGFDDIPDPMLHNKRTGEKENFVEQVKFWREKLEATGSHEGELAAFTAYAMAFPDRNLNLVDTYNTLLSGVPNFLAVALALEDFGYRAVGIRLDSGDLAELSIFSRLQFTRGYEIYARVRETLMRNFDYKIAASNDLNEGVIASLNEQGHEIDIFGIGTDLVTCKAQPAFGGVYKIVLMNGKPVIKLSEEEIKIPLVGHKFVYRLCDADGNFLADALVDAQEDPPKVGEPFLVRDPFKETRRVKIIPHRVEPLHRLVWDGGLTELELAANDIPAARNRVATQMPRLPAVHKRRLNPTPYRVGVSDLLYRQMHELLTASAPIQVIS